MPQSENDLEQAVKPYDGTGTGDELIEVSHMRDPCAGISFCNSGRDLIVTGGSLSDGQNRWNPDGSIDTVNVVANKTKRKQKPQKKQCIARTDGPVDFAGGGLDLVLGVGSGIGFYKFSIPSTGAEGWVASGAFLGGLGGALGVTKGRVDSFGNFTGYGWRGEAQTPISGVGVEVIFGDDGSPAGVAGSVAGGGGYYGGRTKTRVISSNRPVC